ncbi:ribonuclease P protein subunit p29 [Aedes albopictus]|uniref:Ribonuclease P protein subunit p29 n=1 Tax=Aedes albopictus TaxID=7160 RepID=A0ABM1ZHQ1_AEDAL
MARACKTKINNSNQCTRTRSFLCSTCAFYSDNTAFMESKSRNDSTAKAITEGLIKPSERTRFQETRGRTTEMLIPMQKGKAGKPRASEGFKPKKKLSRKEIAQMGIYALPEDTIRYQQVVPLHRLWCGYMARYLGKEKLPDVIESQYTQFALDILKADYHGAKISVVRTKNPSLVGIRGIVILETKGTFKVVSKDNKVRTVPKADSVFQIHWKNVDVTVFGKQLNSRPAERSVKKVKMFPECDLD